MNDFAASCARPNLRTALVALLDDDDEDVRFSMATGLQRIVGENHGYSAETMKALPKEHWQQAKYAWQIWMKGQPKRFPNVVIDPNLVPPINKKVRAFQRKKNAG